jgi:antibiotic biosynthesis monooxygenase (ABM) superfamily enzyme
VKRRKTSKRNDNYRDEKELLTLLTPCWPEILVALEANVMDDQTTSEKMSLQLQALFVAVGIVILLTWVVMPLLIRILRSWLQAGVNGGN